MLIPRLIFVVSILTCCFAAEKLGSYNIDKTAISVSGLSSGGYMAAQMHVIESSTFMGVGVIAGGPYNCADGSLSTALGACMATPSLINVNNLESNAQTQAEKGNIDSLDNLYNSKVYLYSGERDSTVKPGVVYKAETFYERFVKPGNFLTQYNLDSEHGFPTMNNGGACARQYHSTYINDCDYDTAYHILNHIYGGQLTVPSYSFTAPSPAGKVITFDQSEFINAMNPNSIGMEEYGYLFVPDSCADGSKACRLHVSIHGCKQAASFIGDTYVLQTGYNEVAALNDIIVIFPQGATIPISNPNACWDFWGYTGDDYAYHSGKQTKAIMNMIDRLTAGSVPTTPTSVLTTTENLKTTPTSSTSKTSTQGVVTTTTKATGDGILGSYGADSNKVSVSGLASGGFMAIQMHVAESASIMGVGAIAGGPYYCAMNNIGFATTYCMYMPYMINVNLLKTSYENNAGDGNVNALNNLTNDKVYLYSGSKDTVVYTGVVEKAEEFYSGYVNLQNIKTEYAVASQNGFPTMNKGGNCDRINGNGLNNCGFAGAYQLLNHIYGGSLQMRDYSSNEPLQGKLVEFSQAEFTSVSDPTDIGLSETGLVFIPNSCTATNTGCRVHVAFHGCKHGDDSVAVDFANDAGYNEVAALNNIIVLYPRSATILLSNPQDCWDWWGYTDKNYATSDGAQIKAIMNMIGRVVT